MAPGEYAVHFSTYGGKVARGPVCVVLGSLPEAEAYAQQQVAEEPTLRTRIYDHHGLIGEPIREFYGTAYKGPRDMSPTVRRWIGSVLLFGGAAMMLFDWSKDFKLSWPGLIGSRLIIPGLILLVTEVLIHANKIQKSRAAARADTQDRSGYISI